MAQNDVCGLLRRDGLHAFVPERPQIDRIEQRFSSAKQDRRDSDVQFIDQALAKILPDRMRSAADAHVLAGSGFPRLVECVANACGDEVELRAAFHFDRGTSVMSQDEDGNVIGRIVAPPAGPTHVRPRAANGTEHIPSEDPGADVPKAAGGELVVDSGCTGVLAEERLLERPGWQ